MKKVHMIEAAPTLWGDRVKCGRLWRDVGITTKWTRVTCKRCLARRKEAK